MPRYQSFPFEGFGGGLNLRDKPDTVSPAQCIDALNVVFTERGAITPRPGYENGTKEELTNRPESLSPFYKPSGTKQILAGCGTRLEALNSSFEVLKSETGLKGGPYTFARYGKPNTEVAFAGNGEDTLRKWSGTEWTAPKATVNGEAEKAMPKGGYLASWNNLLAVSGFKTTTGGPNGVESSPSHIFFSEEANPEAYESTAYVQLSPGDGEAIQAIIPWREFLFVFKESKFFVFFGVTVEEESGKPIFSYRAVESGVGVASPRAICAHRTGVYFLARNGVYRTTGQEPELLSQLVEPIFTGNASAFYTGGELAPAHITNAAMETWQDRVYLSFPTEEANNRTLIFNIQYEWWSLSNIPAAAMCRFRPSSNEELIFAYASGAKKLAKHFTTYINDAGSAITEYWRQGWFDLNDPDTKKIRATKIWGSGKVQMGMSYDFKQGVGKLQLLNMEEAGGTEWGKSKWGEGEWATPAGLIGAERRISLRGTTFSAYFFNETKDQEWSVHRIEQLMSGIRDPAIISA